MRTASPTITITQGTLHGTEEVTYVKLPLVQAVIDNLLVALNAPAEHRRVYRNYAAAMAELRLQQWAGEA
ncbi:hypothetical protein [Novosphingobium guangzhouense]|uniref:Uncharacterized protein n=1 Tax=Novosphingobium guangzhouense TaxID=1850347 RepID=A0A2K2FYX6_9SPHN|nr:hypothetical protein [Novosphingobium guangzhouense]PNU03954.1 hypothetical protein A8V01_04855 [Novosphingobium guangzhouense]